MELNKIYQGDARKLCRNIDSESIDLIFTDPPYAKEYLYLYDCLAKESSRILKNSGFLLTYCGGYFKDIVILTLGRYLKYYWDIGIFMDGENTIIWPLKMIAGYKSILCYRKDDIALPRCNVYGAWKGSFQDKRFHTWGQDEQTARYYIDCFTKEGDLVFDPFIGGGTTGIVCKRLKRNFIGFEIDEETCELARSRIDGTFVIENEQQNLF